MHVLIDDGPRHRPMNPIDIIKPDATRSRSRLPGLINIVAYVCQIQS